MKNLPDDYLFSKLKLLLEKFEEQPDDDVWEAVSLAISKSEPGWIKKAERSALALVLIMMIGSWYISASITGTAQTEATNSAAVGHSDAGRPGTMPTDHLSTSTKATHATSASQPSSPEARIKGGNTSDANTSTVHFMEAATADNMAQCNEQDYRPRDSSNDRVIAPLEIASLEIIPLAKFDSSSLAEPVSVFNPKRRRKAAWRMYALATPSLTFQQVSASTSDDIQFERLNSPGVLSSERLSFSFEAGTQVYLTKHLAAFAGLTWYQQSLDLSLEQQTNGVRPSAPGGELDFDFAPNTTTTTINYNMQNIGVTAGLSYTLSMGKIVSQLGGALQYEYGLAQAGNESGTQSNNQFFNYRLFYRAEYGLSNRLSVFIQPSYTGTLLHDEVLNGAIKVKQSRAGIGIGVLIKL